MSDHTRTFIEHLHQLREHDLGGLARLRRGLGLPPGSDPRTFPYVERFVGADRHADDPRRKALYLTAGLYARHPQHQEQATVARVLGQVARRRESPSIEQRFIALLGAEAADLPPMLRQLVTLIAADGDPFDYGRLLDDLSVWLRPFNSDARDGIRKRWARDFYRAYDGETEHPTPPTTNVQSGG